MNDQTDLKVTESNFEGGIVLRPHGDIDLSRSPTLRREIAAANGHRPKRLVIDLSDVHYMDSSGIATLVEALQIARRNGATLHVCGLQPRVRSIFEIARLHMVFSIFDDAAAAMAAE